MTDESGPNSARTGELPAGVQARLAWRPPMLHALDALLVGVGGRAGSFLSRAATLVAWHEQLSRRAEPWSGWPTLGLPFQAEAPGTNPSLARPEGSATQVTGESLPRPFRGTTAASSPERPVALSAEPSGPTALPRQGAASPAQSDPAGLSRLDPALVRSGLRLASLRPPSLPARSPHGQAPSQPGWPPVPGGMALGGASSTADQPAARFGPGLTASTSPRQEVRGGFPSQPTLPEVPPGRGEAWSPLPASSALHPVAPPPIPALSPTNGGASPALPTQQPSPLPSPPSRPPEAQSVVERLIEGTLLPAPLPGLELRLVQPDEHAVDETNSPSDAPNPTPAHEEIQREALERAPALDLDVLADRIYQTLQQRQQFEQERRGLY